MESLDSVGQPAVKSVGRAAQVVVVSSVMFSFISYWRTAAIVLCDMSSTAYYIGAIVESAIGTAAPWFILAVLLFSYGMRAVYIDAKSKGALGEPAPGQSPSAEPAGARSEEA